MMYFEMQAFILGTWCKQSLRLNLKIPRLSGLSTDSAAGSAATIGYYLFFSSVFSWSVIFPSGVPAELAEAKHRDQISEMTSSYSYTEVDKPYVV